MSGLGLAPLPSSTFGTPEPAAEIATAAPGSTEAPAQSAPVPGLSQESGYDALTANRQGAAPKGEQLKAASQANLAPLTQYLGSHFGPKVSVSLLRLVRDPKADASLATDVGALVKSRWFQALDPFCQNELARGLAFHVADAETRQEILGIVSQPRVLALEVADQKRLIRIATSRLPGFGDAFRSRILKQQELIAKESLADCVRYTEMLLKNETWLSDCPEPDLRRTPVAFDIVAKRRSELIEFHDGQRRASEYTIAFGQQKIQVFVADEAVSSGLSAFTIQEIASGLAQLPPLLRSQFSRILINNRPGGKYSKDDAVMAVYHPSRVLECFAIPTRERKSEDLEFLLAHEATHLLTLDKLWGRDTSSLAWQPWDLAIACDLFHVRENTVLQGELGGEKTMICEDVADAAAAYCAYKGTVLEEQFRWLFPEKCKILDQMLQ
jgi:hypothetical protein